MHTNIKTQKKYVGITKMSPESRWACGAGYRDNTKFYTDIKKYGWGGFTHEILFDNLNYLQAREIETRLIEENNLIKTGYNQARSSLGEYSDFDYYNFATLNTPKLHYESKNNYFTRVPNIFIQTNLGSNFGLNRIFLLVYIMIDRNRTIENKAYISIGQILKMCGYKLTRRKPKLFHEIIKSILFLQENYFIETSFDIYSIGYNDLIEVRIIADNFDATEKFTKLYSNDLDTIMSMNTKTSKENVLLVFLYINSYIGCRNKKDDGAEYENAKDNPEAFFKSIESMAKELLMSKDTINQTLDYLISDEEHPALFIRKKVGSIPATKTSPPKNVPNIYVLNKDGYQKEIKWALNKMLEVYGVKDFEQKKGI